MSVQVSATNVACKSRGLRFSGLRLLVGVLVRGVSDLLCASVHDQGI